jgi:hypothetical protein
LGVHEGTLDVAASCSYGSVTLSSERNTFSSGSNKALVKALDSCTRGDESAWVAVLTSKIL